LFINGGTLLSVAENIKKHREFLYTSDDFDRIVKMIYQVSGISLSDRKQDMVYSRLARRLRKLAITDFQKYLEFVKQNKDEQREFVNALTTNLTHFFREDHHFKYLTDILFPEIFSKQDDRIRFWSAGCSTGEEPYTLAMVWEHLQNKPSGIDFKILATDLDTNVIETGENAIYSLDKLEPVAKPYQKWFRKTEQCSPNQKQVDQRLKQRIHFKQLNLMNDWPMKGPFQLIICRNVLIYFDKPTQEKLIQRYYDLLEPQGCLILGHSESLGGNRQLFKNCGKTIFRKLD